MNIPFWKMHGAANDFILVDDRSLTFPATDEEWLRQISCRRTGVGCEGIILLQPSQEANFRMRFFNPDGREVEMCGNGARCIARLAYELGAAPAAMSVETAAGVLKAWIEDRQVRLMMPPPTDWRMEKTLTVENRDIRYSHVNVGVPHVVVESDDLDAVDVRGLGAKIRYHEAFQPGGTNVNFMTVQETNTLRVRTYERGVEDETLACGTGITACALVAARQDRVASPVRVVATSKDVLTVGFTGEQDAIEDVTLLGPAVHVFRGTLDYAEKAESGNGKR